MGFRDGSTEAGQLFIATVVCGITSELDDFGNYNYEVAAKAVGFSIIYSNFGVGMSQTFFAKW